MAGGNTKVVQVTNIAPQATKDQMHTLFGFLGKIEDIRLYPTIRDVSCPVQSRICYIKFSDVDTVGIAQHMTNTVFIDRALIVIPVTNGDIPDEYYALEMTKNGTVVPGLTVGEPKLPPHVQNVTYNSDTEQCILTKEPNLEKEGLPPYPPLPSSFDAAKVEETRRTVLLVNVDSSVSNDDIIDFCSTAGEVKYLRHCKKESDDSKYVLVEFTDQSSIGNALKLNGNELKGKPIEVQHATQPIVKPQAKSNEAAQKEIEEAMSRFKEAQNMINASIEPVIGLLTKDKGRSSRRSRSRSRGRRRRSRSRSRSRRRSRSRSRRRRSSSRRRSKSRERRRRSKSRSRRRSTSRSKRSVSKRRSRSRSRKRIRSRSRGRSRDKTRDRSREKKSRDRSREKKSRDRSRERKRSSRDKDRKSSKERESKEKPKVKERESKDRESKEKRTDKESSVDVPEKSRKRSRSRSRSRRRSKSRDRKKDKKRSRSRGGRRRSPSLRRKRGSRSRSRDRKRDKKDKDRKEKDRKEKEKRSRSRSRSTRSTRSRSTRSHSKVSGTFEKEEKREEKALNKEPPIPEEKEPSSPGKNSADNSGGDNMDISNSP